MNLTIAAEKATKKPIVESSPAISIRNVTKSFVRRSGEQVRAIDGISLEIEKGEFLVLLGPSGCGKTTLLRVIAGLEQADSGSIRVDDSVVYDSETSIDVAPESRPASLVFQSYALWPHMTAFDNVAYPLRAQRVPKREIFRRTEEVLDLVGIPDLRDQYPGQMSGGQQQRVALARAIVGGRSVILFDEPLSNVDAKVRDHLRREIHQMQRRLGFTAVYVTHDQEEAMTLGDRIAVLRDGRIAQVDTPMNIYSSPTDRYVATFIGAADQLPGKWRVDAVGKGRIESALGQFATDWRASGGEADVDVTLVVRPEAWNLIEEKSPPADSLVLDAVVESALFLGGGRVEYWLRVFDLKFRVFRGSRDSPLHEGSSVGVFIPLAEVRIFQES